jgi:transcriptional regulator with XRE-family HTH domain
MVRLHFTLSGCNHVNESSPNAAPRPAPEKYKELSRRLRAERERSGVSLRALASRLEISPSALSQIETGKARPSVSSLYAITSELGISLDSLFAPADSHDADDQPRSPSPSREDTTEAPGPVQRADSRNILELQSGVHWERLTPSPDSEVDFLFVAYRPGGSSSGGTELMRHTGREYGIVLEGTLNVTVGFDEYVLGPGDSICFDSTTPHRLYNDGDVPTRAIWVVIGREGDPRAAGLQGSAGRSEA